MTAAVGHGHGAGAGPDDHALGFVAPPSGFSPNFPPSRPVKRTRRLSPRPDAAAFQLRQRTVSESRLSLMAVEEDEGEDEMGADEQEQQASRRGGVLAPAPVAPAPWASWQHAARPHHPIAAAVRIAALMPALAHRRRAAPGVSRLRQSFNINTTNHLNANPASDTAMHPVAAALREAHPATF